MSTTQDELTFLRQQINLYERQVPLVMAQLRANEERIGQLQAKLADAHADYRELQQTHKDTIFALNASLDSVARLRRAPMWTRIKFVLGLA